MADPRAGTVALPYLKAWREKKFMSRAALAAKSGITEGTIFNIESGDVAGARYNTVSKLAEALGITAEELVNVNPDGK